MHSDSSISDYLDRVNFIADNLALFRSKVDEGDLVAVVMNNVPSYVAGSTALVADRGRGTPRGHVLSPLLEEVVVALFAVVSVAHLLLFLVVAILLILPVLVLLSMAFLAHLLLLRVFIVLLGRHLVHLVFNVRFVVALAIPLSIVTTV
ncbi:hypothetical protein L3X38_019945 [Prunus dulcis]|uniref:Uncharacterized protein n=1 Tax=Prunus dulcis TaxID=3755 RepID=A0AAD4ZCJ2_PRUDU|nr:hypothetical protein L3X38_019945 [Prunus dulcis]